MKRLEQIHLKSKNRRNIDVPGNPLNVKKQPRQESFRLRSIWTSIQKRCFYILRMFSVPTSQPRQESNLHLKFRKLLFYPLNYGAKGMPKIVFFEVSKNVVLTILDHLWDTERKIKNVFVQGDHNSRVYCQFHGQTSIQNNIGADDIFLVPLD